MTVYEAVSDTRPPPALKNVLPILRPGGVKFRQQQT